MKSYSELISLNSYAERLDYLKTYSDNPGNEHRMMMNHFYKSKQWLRVREQIIKRDLACDLGIQNNFIDGSIIIHHINPITEKDLEEFNDKLFDPENLICVSYDTHNKIHYSNRKTQLEFVERKPGDTKLW